MERAAGRAGFSNAHLIAGIALFLVITLLLQIQSGAINPLSLVPAKAPAAAAGGGKGKRAKGIEMLPGTPSALPSPARPSVVPPPLLRVPRQESIQSFARMGSEEAAAVLRELPPETAAEVLAQLKERDIARILEAAQPAAAAGWVQLLLAMRTPPELPADLILPEPAPGAVEPGGTPAEAAEAGEAPAAGSEITPGASEATASPPGEPSAGGAAPPTNPASPASAVGNSVGANGAAARDPRRPRPNLA